MTLRIGTLLILAQIQSSWRQRRSMAMASSYLQCNHQHQLHLPSIRPNGFSFFKPKTNFRRTQLIKCTRKQVEVSILSTPFFFPFLFVAIYLLFIYNYFFFPPWLVGILGSVWSWWKEKQVGRWSRQGSSSFKAHSVLTLQGFY